jgi:hypothetical protein
LQLGYKPVDNGGYYRMPATYRGGDNKTSLSVNKKTGMWKDFVTGASGTLKQLVDLHNRIIDVSILDASDNIAAKRGNQDMRVEKTYSKDILKELVPHYDFFLNRGISEKTLKEFNVGFAHKGKLNRRNIIPIFSIDSDEFIIGFTGRYYHEKVPLGIIKYKHLGRKDSYIWPGNKSKPFIKASGEVYLVESPMCCLALWEVGIKNTLCLFGLSLSSKLLSYIIAQNPKKIFICTNNEESGRGNAAAMKIKEKLLKFFNPESIIVKLPSDKDFSKMLELDKNGDSIREWAKNG